MEWGVKKAYLLYTCVLILHNFSDILGEIEIWACSYHFWYSNKHWVVQFVVNLSIHKCGMCSAPKRMPLTQHSTFRIHTSHSGFTLHTQDSHSTLGIHTPHSGFTLHTQDLHSTLRIYTPHSGFTLHTRDSHSILRIHTPHSGFTLHTRDSHSTLRIHTPHSGFTLHTQDSHSILRTLRIHHSHVAEYRVLMQVTIISFGPDPRLGRDVAPPPLSRRHTQQMFILRAGYQMSCDMRRKQKMYESIKLEGFWGCTMTVFTNRKCLL